MTVLPRQTVTPNVLVVSSSLYGSSGSLSNSLVSSSTRLRSLSKPLRTPVTSRPPMNLTRIAWGESGVSKREAREQADAWAPNLVQVLGQIEHLRGSAPRRHGPWPTSSLTKLRAVPHHPPPTSLVGCVPPQCAASGSAGRRGGATIVSGRCGKTLCRPQSADSGAAPCANSPGVGRCGLPAPVLPLREQEYRRGVAGQACTVPRHLQGAVCRVCRSSGLIDARG